MAQPLIQFRYLANIPHSDVYFVDTANRERLRRRLILQLHPDLHHMFCETLIRLFSFFRSQRIVFVEPLFRSL